MAYGHSAGYLATGAGGGRRGNVMTADRARKTRIRERMAATGEPYVRAARTVDVATPSTPDRSGVMGIGVGAIFAAGEFDRSEPPKVHGSITNCQTDGCGSIVIVNGSTEPGTVTIAGRFDVDGIGFSRDEETGVLSIRPAVAEDTRTKNEILWDLVEETYGPTPPDDFRMTVVVLGRRGDVQFGNITIPEGNVTAESIEPIGEALQMWAQRAIVAAGERAVAPQTRLTFEPAVYDRSKGLLVQDVHEVPDTPDGG